MGSRLAEFHGWIGLPEPGVKRPSDFVYSRPTPRLLSTLAVVLVIVVVVVMARRGPETTYTPLFDDASFSSVEVIQMTAALRKAGLDDSHIDGRQILVPRDRVEDYLVALHKAGSLPGDFDDVPAETTSFNPFATRDHIQRSQLEADKRKLERILTGMSGIESASVQYTQVKKPGFPPVEETRAVVAVRKADRQHLRLDEVEAMRNTVVAYVAGLDRRDVTITDLNAFHAYPGDDTGLADNYAVNAISRMWETDLQSKIERQLAMVPGVIVGVNAHFEEFSADLYETSGEPVKPRPVLVTASIGVPDNYYRLIWQQRNQLATSKPNAEELHRIEEEVTGTVARSVLPILPPPAVGWETGKQVEVTTYDSLAVSAEAAPADEASSRNNFPPFIGVLSALGMIVVVGWVFVRRAASSRAVPPTLPLAAETPETQAQPPSSPDSSLKQELRQAIQQDPNAAAKLLGQWLRDAA